MCCLFKYRGGKEKVLVLENGGGHWSTSSIKISFYGTFSPSCLSKQRTLPHSGKFPAVTHLLIFQTACKMTSRQCNVAGAVSAKNVYYYVPEPSW